MALLCTSALWAGVGTIFAGCGQWMIYRCTLSESEDSKAWRKATEMEFEAVPRLCRSIRLVYEQNLDNLQWAPPGGYRMNFDDILNRMTYEQVKGLSPPYLVYLDHGNREIVVAIRGLNVAKQSNYDILLNNNPETTFDGGYVHRGLFQSALHIFKTEVQLLKNIWEGNREYDLVLAGHSLGSGVASLLAVIAVTESEQLGGIPPRNVELWLSVGTSYCRQDLVLLLQNIAM